MRTVAARGRPQRLPADLRPVACEALRKGWYCPLFLEGGELLYWDSNHWTEAGARRVGQALRASGQYDYLF